MNRNKYFFTLFSIIVLISLFIGCSGATAQSFPTHVPHKTVTIPLRVLAQQRGILIGAAVNMDALNSDAQYGATLEREFDEVTPENVMKWDAVHPQPNVYTFQQADELVSFAQAHGMTVHGHNLVWYLALPAWIENGHFTRDQLMTILKNHIFTVVSHFRGSVNIWDVVNEAIANDGTLRQNIWLQTIGPDYIDLAFQWAHEANPQAHLFYNDYGDEGSGVKSDAVYNLLKGMLQRGVPVYGVGLQMHVSTTSYPSPSSVLANMQRLAALGLKVQISEMDVEVQNDTRSMTQRLTAQATIYGDILHDCLSVRACISFASWGFTDRYSWIPAVTGHADEPLIFDMSYQPKPAYYALEQTLEAA